MKAVKENWLAVIICIIMLVWFFNKSFQKNSYDIPISENENSAWVGPGKYQISLSSDSGKLIAYGRDLIENTSTYLGPKGSVSQITNGMNCQNCHLSAGTIPWGNNYGAVASLYPQFRARSGGMETIVKRISDCMERSLNAAKAVDSNSREMNTAAGLFRLSRFAGYVKNNMPFGEVSYHNPDLTNEEAWDVAAFVNSQPRPVRIFKEDWPDISKKPIDHPFGPFADNFTEEQHKYGPFKPIKKLREEAEKNKTK